MKIGHRQNLGRFFFVLNEGGKEMKDDILVRGAKVHNLKNIDVDIQKIETGKFKKGIYHIQHIKFISQ